MLIHSQDESLAPSVAEAENEERLLTSWIDEMLQRDVLRHGGRLCPVSDATVVRAREGEILISDGPFAETKEQIAGYDVIECADLDEALDIAARHPTILRGTIEVRPFLDGE